MCLFGDAVADDVAIHAEDAIVVENEAAEAEKTAHGDGSGVKSLGAGVHVDLDDVGIVQAVVGSYHTSSSEQQRCCLGPSPCSSGRRRWFQSCMVRPTMGWPCSWRTAATVEESTPPDMAMAIRPRSVSVCVGSVSNWVVVFMRFDGRDLSCACISKRLV